MELNLQSTEALESLQEKTGLNITTIVNRALQIYDQIDDIKKEGVKIL